MPAQPSSGVVSLRSPADVVGCVPYQVGFHPRESLVVLCLHGPRRRSGLTMRIDLPPPHLDRDLAVQMAARVAYDGADGAVVVCYTEATDSGGVLPRQRLVDALLERLRARGIDASEGILVRGGRWWSYRCRQPCCPPEGTPLPAEPTAATTRVAAEAAAGGTAVLPDRDALAASIRPQPATLASAGLQQTHDRVADAFLDACHSRGAAAVDAETLDLLRALVRRYATGERRVADSEAARVAVGLADKRVRDEAATLSLDPGADALLVLLADVAQRAIAEHAPPVCTLLAWVAYAQGNGGLANVAIERALECDPDYEMALLLATGISRQVPPSAVRELTRQVRRTLRGSDPPTAHRRRRDRRR
jgi:Domain of unknown function (DUF4192)